MNVSNTVLISFSSQSYIQNWSFIPCTIQIFYKRQFAYNDCNTYECKYVLWRQMLSTDQLKYLNCFFAMHNKKKIPFVLCPKVLQVKIQIQPSPPPRMEVKGDIAKKWITLTVDPGFTMAVWMNHGMPRQTRMSNTLDPIALLTAMSPENTIIHFEFWLYLVPKVFNFSHSINSNKIQTKMCLF